MTRHFYTVPSHVAMVEAYELFCYMATGETKKTEYLDPRHQCIFNILENLLRQIGRVGTQQLVADLSRQHLLEKAGGLAYVQKVFNCLETMEAVI